MLVSGDACVNGYVCKVSCCLSVLADGFGRKMQNSGEIPHSYTHRLHRPGIRGSAAVGERLEDLKRKGGTPSNWNSQNR